MKNRPAFVASALIFGSLISFAAADDFQPEYEKAELRGSQGAKYARVGIALKPRRTHDAGGLKFAVDGDAVEILPTAPEVKRKHVPSADGRKLRLLGTVGGIALFAAENTEDEINAGRHDLPAEIRRCDLDAGHWLPSWKIEDQNERQRDPTDPDDIDPVLGGVLTRYETVVVLTYDRPSGFARAVPSNATTTSYTITCYDADKTRPRWAKTFPWVDKQFPPVMLARDFSRSRNSSIELLTWADDKAYEPPVLVCAGAKQDLLCLAGESGEVQWRIPKLWEFERGFIGPSVFEHYVDRFGIDYMDLRLAERPDAEDADEREQQERGRRLLSERRKKFEEEFDGSIAAGPVFATDDFSGHLFVAAARRRADGGWQDLGGLAQCVVYELEADSGEVIAATALPRMVDGSPYKAIPGALVWSCDRGCLVRLNHSRFGPEDAICRVGWYREYEMRFPACWFSADPPHGVAAFDDKHLYRAAATYIENKDETVYRFVINVVNLETGIDRDLTLAVPYHGEFPMPEHGYFASPGYTHAHQPHLLGISELAVEDGTLRIVMQRPGKNTDDAALRFKLPNE